VATSGYVSTIAHIEFNNVLTKQDFQAFIEATANDISTGPA
jgi:hypothetical protein